MRKTSGKIHGLLSLMIGAMVAFRYTLPLEGVLFCLLGGLFPDTDIKTSKLGRVIPLWIWIKPHRKNILHSVLGAVLITLPIFYFSYPYALFFFIGYCSHLLLDMCNKTGIPLLYPKKRMISIAKFRSGGISEWLLLIVFYMIGILILSL